MGGHPAPDVAREEWAEHLAAQPNSIIGSPEDAIAAITAIREQTGAGGLLITAKEWATPAQTKQSWELFARRVMPHFQGSLVGLQASEAAARATVPDYVRS